MHNLEDTIDIEMLVYEKKMLLEKADLYIYIDKYIIRDNVVYYYIELGVKCVSKCYLYHSLKRYSEIRSLYDYYRNIYDVIHTANFPERYYFGNLKPDNIQKRLCRLNGFLSLFCGIKYILSDHYFRDFFHIDDDS